MTEKTNETDTPWAPGLDEWWRFTTAAAPLLTKRKRPKRPFSRCASRVTCSVAARKPRASQARSRRGAGAIKLMVDLENIGAQRLYDILASGLVNLSTSGLN
jgi:hypothetical protein